MPVYDYQSFDASGSVVRGTLTADSAARGRQLLRERGLSVLAFCEALPQGRRASHRCFARWRASAAFGRHRRNERAAEFARQLALLLSTGTPLVEALNVLIRQQRGRLATVLRDVREKVSGGSALSEALAGHPEWFGAMFCRAVNVGQASGQLDEALREMSSFLRERQTHRARFVGALAYPMILAVLSVGVVLFLMSYVVPELLTVLAASGRELPVSTVVLKRMSDILIEQWRWILGSAALLAAGVGMVLRSRSGRRAVEVALLRLPVFGPLFRKNLIAEFAQAMALLLRSGVTFVEAIGLVRSGVRHLQLREELNTVEDAVRRGSDIAPALANSQVFTPLVVHMVNVGQNTGALPDMFGEMKEGYEAEVRLALAQFTSALEPVLIVMMAGVVGFIVFAVMTPILEVTRTIQ